MILKHKSESPEKEGNYFILGNSLRNSGFVSIGLFKNGSWRGSIDESEELTGDFYWVDNQIKEIDGRKSNT